MVRCYYEMNNMLIECVFFYGQFMNDWGRESACWKREIHGGIPTFKVLNCFFFFFFVLFQTSVSMDIVE